MDFIKGDEKHSNLKPRIILYLLSLFSSNDNNLTAIVVLPTVL